MLSNELLYQIALTLVPDIGPRQAKVLIDHFETASNVFNATKRELTGLEGIGEIRAESIKKFRDFERADEEICFIEKYKIKPLFLNDDNYPWRLLDCWSPPTVLYFKGTANLNAPRIVGIVGTRCNTEYGQEITETLMKDLSSENVLVVSGLALGIDTVAHKSALYRKLPTVGVLGHGLDRIYPFENRSLAKEMIKSGGLLTEFPYKTKSEKFNFPIRNRIIAGMSDVIVVVETDVKGGSMITAELANSYNKDVFAFPGLITKNNSAGCNYLIRSNKAVLLTSAEQLIEAMLWERKQPKKE